MEVLGSTVKPDSQVVGPGRRDQWTLEEPSQAWDCLLGTLAHPAAQADHDTATCITPRQMVGNLVARLQAHHMGAGGKAWVFQRAL